MIIYLKRAARHRALSIRRSLGVRKAAGYLRNQGWSCEGAVAFLCRP